MKSAIKIFKHSSVRINKVYVDPYKIDEFYNDAEYIFITHSHYDHYSKDDIDKIVNDNTKFIVPFSMKDDFDYDNEVLYVEPNKKYTIDNIEFETIPMYNINKKFHKKEYNWCGYNICINNIYYYFVGDSDDIPEIHSVKCDYIFIPIGGIYTMDINEAIECLKTVDYKYVIPYHYGTIVGSVELGIYFKDKMGERCILKIWERNQ